MRKITNYFDHDLQKITRCRSEEVFIPKHMNFGQYLHSIFKNYPEIEKKYPPGTLSFTLNQRRPYVYDILNDGDIVNFKVVLPSCDMQNTNGKTVN